MRTCRRGHVVDEANSYLWKDNTNSGYKIICAICCKLTAKERYRKKVLAKGKTYTPMVVE